MDENRMNQLIDAIKDLKSNTLLEVISTIIIPLSVLILTSMITLKINKRQQEFQLKQQQIALKKELKVKALSEIRLTMVEYTRQLALLEIELKRYSSQRIDLETLGEKLLIVEEECRKNKVKINANKCLITDFNINYEILDETIQCASHSIYFNYCYPELEIPKMFRRFVINDKDPEALVNKIEQAILRIDEIFKLLDKEINKTIDSII